MENKFHEISALNSVSASYGNLPFLIIRVQFSFVFFGGQIGTKILVWKAKVIAKVSKTNRTNNYCQ